MENNYSPRVAIITLNWNGFDDTVACVESLLTMSIENFQIYVVDNASENNEVERLREKFSGRENVSIITNPNNDGYAEGNNVGYRQAQKDWQPDFYWFLNNDTVVQKDCVNELLAVATSNPKLGIIGATIRNWQSDTLYCMGGGHFSLWTGIDRLYGAKKPTTEVQPPAALDYISGCSLFARSAVIEQLKGFDPDYFLYSEEADLCLRAMRQGWKLGFAPDAFLQHKSAATTGHLSPTYVYYFLRNKLLFMKKNATTLQWLTFMPFFLLYYCLGFLWLLGSRGKFENAKYIAKAIEDFLGRRWGYQPLRR